MNILTAYYRISAYYLKDHLPCIPTLKLTNAKSYLCHEFAHMLFWEHGDNHTEVTELFKTVVINKLQMREINKQLNVLNC